MIDKQQREDIEKFMNSQENMSEKIPISTDTKQMLYQCGAHLRGAAKCDVDAIAQLIDGIKAGYEGRVAELEERQGAGVSKPQTQFPQAVADLQTEMVTLKLLLAEACAMLESTRCHSPHPARIPPKLIARCSPELRSWYGAYRAQQRGPEPAGKEMWAP